MRRTEKAKGGCMLFAGSEMGEVKALTFLASKEEGTNYSGVVMMIRLEAWAYS